MTQTRRGVLALAAGLGGLAFAGPAETAVCYDPATLPLTQKNRRRALGYVAVSPDPKKHCVTCAFFTAATAGCGKCAMLSGGPVDEGGVCNSFAPRGK